MCEWRTACSPVRDGLDVRAIDVGKRKAYLGIALFADGHCLTKGACGLMPGNDCIFSCGYVPEREQAVTIGSPCPSTRGHPHGGRHIRMQMAIYRYHTRRRERDRPGLSLWIIA